nr:lysylphosphatidylglycerol synthase transmembrane domain-containing protein [Hungatella effluvii]
MTILKQKRMHKRQMLICLAVLAVLSWMTFHILFKDHSPEALYEVFSRADWRFVGLGVACMAVYLICEAESIRTLMGAFQTKVPFLRSAGYSFADFYFSAITPSATGGQPMQLYYMTRDGFGFAQSSFSLLTLAAVYQLMVLVYGVVMVIVKYPYVQSQGRLIKWLLLFGIAVNGICSLGILLVILKRALVERIAMIGITIAVKLRIIKDRKKMERKAEHLIDEYSRGGECFRKYPLVFVKVVILTALRLTALFMIPYFACLALGIGDLGPFEFLAVQAILSLAVTAVPLPGSVGASEGSFMLLYSGVVAAGNVFPMMMLSRGISFYGFLAVSGAATLLLQFWKAGYTKEYT